jgi:hypothetical protein
MMKQILEKMPDTATALPDLVRIFDRNEGRLRHDLMEMVDLGLVEKVAIDQPGKNCCRRRVGWRKTVRK